MYSLPYWHTYFLFCEFAVFPIIDWLCIFATHKLSLVSRYYSPMSQVPNHIKPQVWIHAAILKIYPFPRPRPISPSLGASSLFLPVDSSSLYKPMSISSGSTSKSISSGSTSKFVSYHFSLNWIVCIQRIVGLNLIGFNL